MTAYRHPIRALCPTVCLALAVMLQSLPACADSLRTQLEALAKQQGILVDGLPIVGDEPSRPVTGTPEEQVKSLLSDYNFMTAHEGHTKRFTITSLKQAMPRPRPGGVVKTQKWGAHHQVSSLLNGPNGIGIRTNLIIDTGATTLVLPESMIGELGFDAQSLQTNSSQTAAGIIPVKIGMLNSVRVGDVEASNVTVSFISDRRLNGTRLLGMSFLNHFKFSLDDGQNELRLSPK